MNSHILYMNQCSSEHNYGNQGSMVAHKMSMSHNTNLPAAVSPNLRTGGLKAASGVHVG